MKPKIVRSATVGTSLASFCAGLLRELSEEYEVVAISAPDEDLAELGRSEGVRTVGVPMERHIAPLKDLRSLWRMWRVLRRERPTMVHSMTPKAGLITMLAAWLARVPVRVHTFTGLVWPTATGLKRRILMATDRLTCACATHIIPEGEGVRRDLATITSRPMRVLGHGNVRGIDLAHYVRSNKEQVTSNKDQAERNKEQGTRKKEQAESNMEQGTRNTSRPHEPIPAFPSLSRPSSSNNNKKLKTKNQELKTTTPPFTFLFVGRLVGDKGVNELVRAFVRLHDEEPGTRLVLVGHEESALDPLEASTVHVIEQCAAIEPMGEQRDVRPFYEDAHVLVLPSYREGFPNVVIEAGAMELPCIVTDINGANEIIIDGRNGIIIPPRDEEALYRAMLHAVRNQQEMARMAAQARPLVAERYEQGYVRRCLREFYHEIIADYAD